MTDAQILAIAHEAAQCIRAHGVPDFPEPVLENGRLTIPGGDPGPGADQALEACRSIVDRLPPSVIGEGEGPVSVEDLQNLRKFAACMRQNGMPDWPDPKDDGSFPISGTAIEAEGKSDRFMRATQACRQHWDKGIRGS